MRKRIFDGPMRMVSLPFSPLTKSKKQKFPKSQITDNASTSGAHAIAPNQEKMEICASGERRSCFHRRPQATTFSLRFRNLTVLRRIGLFFQKAITDDRI
jgi:hypothetical protein